MKLAVVVVILFCFAIAGATIWLVHHFDKYDPWQ